MLLVVELTHADIRYIIDLPATDKNTIIDELHKLGRDFDSIEIPDLKGDISIYDVLDIFNADNLEENIENGNTIAICWVTEHIIKFEGGTIG